MDWLRTETPLGRFWTWLSALNPWWVVLVTGLLLAFTSWKLYRTGRRRGWWTGGRDAGAPSVSDGLGHVIFDGVLLLLELSGFVWAVSRIIGGT